MVKLMLFIDGTWLYSNTPRLSEAYGQADFRLDFGKLPQVLADEVGKQLGNTEVDVVRTYLFGSYAANYDLRDDEAVQRRRDFFDMLREEYHYEVETYPINFLGRRVRRADRDPADPFDPKEKCVDISLATAMLYYAAIPHAYDIGVAVVGDQDFKPVFQHVRRLGKRVAIASIKGSCAPEYTDPRDEARVRDFDVIWLDNLLHRLELKYERHLLTCESPIHRGKREVWTTFHPRKGQKFFCDVCRREFSGQRQDTQRDLGVAAGAAEGDGAEGVPPAPVPANPTGLPFVSPPAPSLGGSDGFRELVVSPAPTRPTLLGVVKRKISERGFGFIDAADGHSYFFHLTDLQYGLLFDEVMEGLPVAFEVKRQPTEERAGAAQNVRRQPRTEPRLEARPELRLPEPFRVEPAPAAEETSAEPAPLPPPSEAPAEPAEAE